MVFNNLGFQVPESPGSSDGQQTGILFGPVTARGTKLRTPSGMILWQTVIKVSKRIIKARTWVVVGLVTARSSGRFHQFGN